MSQSTQASQGTYLAQPAWYLVKEFAGIYGVKMNYQAVKKLNVNIISNAYFNYAKLPPITRTITYDRFGNPEKLRTFKIKDWINIILKRAAMGYKNRLFYESLAKSLHPPDVRCPCGAMVCGRDKDIRRHRSTKAHINAMLALDSWTNGKHHVTLPKKDKDGEFKRSLWQKGIYLDISQYIGGTITDVQADHSVSPPIITIVRTLHTYDSIINDIKAKHGVIRDGLEVYGPFDTRKKTFTRVFQPTKEQHASIIQLGQDHLSNQH